jgi:hypothetical protein
MFNADRSFRRTPCPSGTEIYPRTERGHGVGRRTGLFGYHHACCAVQPHAPTIGSTRWGMGCGGNRQCSTPIDRSAARRARLEPKSTLALRAGTALDGERACSVITTLVAPSNPMPQRVLPIVGVWGAAGTGNVRRRSIVPPHAVPVWDIDHRNRERAQRWTANGPVGLSPRLLRRPTPCPNAYRPTVGAWGAAGTGNSSTTIDHSAARRARLRTKFCLTPGRAQRWTANGLVRLSPRLLRRPTPCPNAYRPTVGAWGAAGTGNVQRRSIVPPHAVPVWDIDHRNRERAQRWTANGLVWSSTRSLRRPTPCPNGLRRRGWGMGCGGNRRCSTPIDRSAARRARLG